MRLIVTGGGTGGHIYPALEVARRAIECGVDVRYFGSERGQERAACAARNLPFRAFPSAPLYSLRQPRGWRSLLALTRASGMAKRALREAAPDVVFSTGGYSAAPVLWGARSLGIPTVLLESNSVPGRTTRMFMPTAKAFGYVFRHTEGLVSGANGVRTGQPVRQALRDAAANRQRDPEPLVIVIGGSQGSKYLNDAVPLAAAQLPGVRFVHATGKANFEAVTAQVAPLNLGERYRLVPYIEQEVLLATYQRATLAVARSGGTLAEFAVFGLPSVLVPLPQSADDHQRVNAEEFARMQAATVCPQSAATPPPADIDYLVAGIREWIEDRDACNRAASALANWDVPDATDRLFAMIEGAAR